MKLIVGLGNPGKEYIRTRHNIGFMVIDNYLGEVKWQEKFNSLFFEMHKDNEKVIFVKPLTYVNLSGSAVYNFMSYYKINLEDVLIVHDDLYLNVGDYKLKKNSGAGGHNGLKSIIERLGTNEFVRLKIGISNNKMMDTADYVLGKITSVEMKKMEKVYSVSNEIIDSFISYGISKTMNVYNTKDSFEEESDEVSK